MSSQSVGGKTVSHDEYEFDGGVKITIVPGATAGSSGGNARSIMTLIDAHSIGTCGFVQTGQPDRSCILTARAPIIGRR